MIVPSQVFLNLDVNAIDLYEIHIIISVNVLSVKWHITYLKQVQYFLTLTDLYFIQVFHIHIQVDAYPIYRKRGLLSLCGKLRPLSKSYYLIFYWVPRYKTVLF